MSFHVFIALPAPLVIDHRDIVVRHVVNKLTIVTSHVKEMAITLTDALAHLVKKKNEERKAGLGTVQNFSDKRRFFSDKRRKDRRQKIENDFMETDELVVLESSTDTSRKCSSTSACCAVAYSDEVESTLFDVSDGPSTGRLEGNGLVDREEEVQTHANIAVGRSTSASTGQAEVYPLEDAETTTIVVVVEGTRTDTHEDVSDGRKRASRSLVVDNEHRTIVEQRSRVVQCRSSHLDALEHRLLADAFGSPSTLRNGVDEDNASGGIESIRG